MAAPRRRPVLVWTLALAVMVLAAAVGYTVGTIDTNDLDPSDAASRAAVSVADQGTGYGAAMTPSQEALESAKQDASIQSDPADAAAGAGDTLIIRNSNMEVRVKSVDQAVDLLRVAAAKAGAEISEMSLSAGDPGPVPLESDGSSGARGPATAYVTMRVAAERLAELEQEVAGLGTVLSQSSSAADVTEQAIDLEARLRNLRAEEARLRSFLQRTAKVSELLEVERELARVRGEIESMDAQLTYLQRQAARATLAVTLSEPGPVVQPAGPSWGLREAITRGIQATASLIATVITIAIPLAVLGGVALVIALPVRALIRRRSARQTAARQDDAHDEEHT